FWMLLGNPYQLLLSVLYGTILALAAPRNASRGLMVGFSLFFFATVLGMADASENPWVAGCEVFQRNWYWMAPPLIGMSCSTGLVTAIRRGAAPRRPATRT
ncbi:MAG: hypothetical protein H7Z41_03015, partial [Cytophagales bacterium]|nr:hypothetical protein [Armatimonadota bacterium]